MWCWCWVSVCEHVHVRECGRERAPSCPRSHHPAHASHPLTLSLCHTPQVTRVNASSLTYTTTLLAQAPNGERALAAAAATIARVDGRARLLCQNLSCSLPPSPLPTPAAAPSHTHTWPSTPHALLPTPPWTRRLGHRCGAPRQPARQPHHQRHCGGWLGRQHHPAHRGRCLHLCRVGHARDGMCVSGRGVVGCGCWRGGMVA